MIITGALCNKCGESIYWHTHLGKVYVVKWLRDAGWSVGKRDNDGQERTLCPKCREKSRKNIK